MCKPATLEGAIRTILTITATAIIFKRHLGRVSAFSDLIGLAVLVVGIFSRCSNMFGLMSYKDCLVDSAKYVLMSDIGFVGTIKTKFRFISGKGKTFMPIYEYKCVDCGVLTSVFTKSINSVVEAVCVSCQSTDMNRLMSSFSMGKTTQSVHENSSYGSANSAEYYSDPRNIGRHVEEGFKKYGVDMPQGVRDSIESARSGELPKGLKE